MNRNETVHLTGALQGALERLEIIIKVLEIGPERIRPEEIEYTKSIYDFFQYLKQSENLDYLFAQGRLCHGDWTLAPDNLVESQIECFGVYKFFPSIGKKAESNYCKISIPAILVTDGMKNPIQLYLSNLTKPGIRLADKATNANANANGIYIEREDLIKAIVELKNHYQAILAFL